MLRELSLGRILDVSEEMLDSNLLGLGSSNRAWDMHELPIDVALGIGFLLCEIGLSGQGDLLLVLNSDNDEDWVGIVASQDFIDLDV